MLSVIIKNDGEDRVVQLTYENLWRELKDIPGAELIVSEDWFDYLPKIKNIYVCFVEADCLVGSGYFISQLGLFKKDPMFKKMAVMSSSTCVNNWANRFFGYSINNDYSDGIVPNYDKKSKVPYPVEVAYIPGSIMRAKMLTKLLDSVELPQDYMENLVAFSTQLSLGFWRQGMGRGKDTLGTGNRVYINPNSTYVTTEGYVNGITDIKVETGDIRQIFSRESI